MLVCLDFDGCLVDSRAAIATAVNHALTAHGLVPQRHEDLQHCIGPPLMGSFARLLVDQGADPAGAVQCVGVYRDVYPALALELTTVVDGVPQALDALAHQATLVVVTSKPAAFTEPLLDALGLRDFFAQTFAPGLAALHETKTETLSRALEQFAPNAAVMVGDRCHDIVAGRSCDVPTIGVTWGIGSPDELRRAGADVLIDDPGDLPAVILTSQGGTHASRETGKRRR